MTYYDDIADGYDDLHQEEQEKKLDLIRKHIVIQKEESLLDVGCGSGLSTRCWDCRRTGIDPSMKLVEIARAADPAGEYLVGKAEALPFADRSFNIVISVTAIQNFDDIVAGLREMKRVGHDNFVLSVLQRSENFQVVMRTILANFPVSKILREEKDVIFLCGTKTFIKSERDR